MQIRYCINCKFQKREDDFELKHTEENKCPVCDSWLWSLNIEPDGIMEIMDWDECGIHDRELLKILKRSIEVIEKSQRKISDSLSNVKGLGVSKFSERFTALFMLWHV